MTSILIVEDEAPIASVLGELFEDEGYDVRVVSNGQAGLAALDVVHPQVVLSDVMMPLLDGWGLCRAMHAHPEHHTIPVVLMSAAPLDPKHDDCPYRAFLHKPLDLDAVLRVVTQSLS